MTALRDFYKVPLERIVAIHDELDIDFGTLRVKFGGGDNGHNGLRSMRQSLGTGDFYRVRVGIGRPPGRQAAADFVLQRLLRASSARSLPFQVDRAADAVESLVTDGLERTQNASTADIRSFAVMRPEPGFNRRARRARERLGVESGKQIFRQ